MARLGRNLAALVLLAGLGTGAYLTRDRWMGHLPGLSGPQQQAATPDQAGGGRAGQRGGGRRGGRFGGGLQGPVAVLAAAAEARDVPVTVTGVGTAQPLNTVTVRTQVDGQLVAVLFKEGQDVKKGDVLARVDDRSYKAQLDQAVAKRAQDQATLDNAKRDLQRYLDLAATNSVTRQQADTQRATVAQAEAQLQSDDAAIAIAQVTLGYTTVRAPIDGRTGIRNVDEGNLVHASDTTGIVTVSQIKPISVLFSVPQQQLGAINAAVAGGPLSVEALSGSGEVIDRGTLLVVDNQVDPTTGTVKLKASFPNEALALWPGAFLNARLLVSTLKGAIVVPSAAIQRGPDGTFVYRLKDDQTASVTKVTVGQQDDQIAVITQGLAAGDRVITTGFARLTDGAKVQVGDAAAPAASAAARPGADAEPSQSDKPPAAGQQRHQRRNPNAETGTAPPPAAP